MKQSTILALVVALAACSHGRSQREPQPAKGPPETAAYGEAHGQTGVAGGGAETRSGAQGPSPDAAVKVLGEAIELLQTSDGAVAVGAAARGLQALSVLLEAATQGEGDAAEVLSRRAQELRAVASGEGAERGEREPLGSSLTAALDAATSARADLATDPAIRQARRAIASMRVDQPLERQGKAAAAALCTSGLALGLAAHVQQSDTELRSCDFPGLDAATRPQAARAEVEELRATVERLGTSGWEDALAAAATLLDLLADGFDRAGLAPGFGQPLRSRADELRSLDRLSLERSDRLKTALAVAVTGLDELARERGPAMAGWVSAAERAVRNVDARVPFGLARAPIQDAARAVVDAFAAAATLDPVCR